MLRLRIQFIICFLFTVVTFTFGNDTLLLKTYLDIVTENYPLIKSANLFDEFSRAYELKGKGAFDPKIASNFEKKNFKDTDYFTIWQTEAKIPTTLPIDFSVGYENNDGSFLNNEGFVPDNGLIYGTLNLSVLRGLIFDEQRYNLKMAELKGLKGQIDKEVLTREILYQAIVGYLNWSTSHYQNEVLATYLEGIQARHLNIIDLFTNGAVPAIDTIESRVNLNSANKRYLESVQSLNIEKQKLALFLWDEEENPLALLPEVKPGLLVNTTEFISELSALDTPDFNKDPLIQKFDNQNEQLALMNRLEKENLKPRLDLKYNAIVNLGDENINPTYSANDYKIGVSVEVPILNRKTKGNIRLNEATIAQNKLSQLQYSQGLVTKFNIINSNRAIQLGIIDIINEKIGNSQTLYEAEVIKLDLGESSVFMINKREQKLLEARIELLTGYFKYGKTVTELYYLKMGQE